MSLEPLPPRWGSTRAHLASLTAATKANVAAFLVAAAGVALQLLAGDASMPAVRSALVFSLAAAGLVGLGRWPWVPVVGVAVPLFLLVAGMASSAGRDNLTDPESSVVLVGALAQYGALIAALIPGSVALRRSRRLPTSDSP